MFNITIVIPFIVILFDSFIVLYSNQNKTAIYIVVYNSINAILIANFIKDEVNKYYQARFQLVLETLCSKEEVK